VRVEPNKCELKAVVESRERDGVCRFADDAYDLDNSEVRGPASDMSIEQTEGLLKAPGAAEWVSHISLLLILFILLFIHTYYSYLYYCCYCSSAIAAGSTLLSQLVGLL
jgi:hypothetical protein